MIIIKKRRKKKSLSCGQKRPERKSLETWISLKWLIPDGGAQLCSGKLSFSHGQIRSKMQRCALWCHRLRWSGRHSEGFGGGEKRRGCYLWQAIWRGSPRTRERSFRNTSSVRRRPVVHLLEIRDVLLHQRRWISLHYECCHWNPGELCRKRAGFYSMDRIDYCQRSHSKYIYIFIYMYLYIYICIYIFFF